MSESAPPTKKWTECSYCGHWFGQELSNCPQCKQPNDGKGPTPADPREVDVERAIGISSGIIVSVLIVIAVIVSVAPILPRNKVIGDLVLLFVFALVRPARKAVLRMIGVLPDQEQKK